MRSKVKSIINKLSGNKSCPVPSGSGEISGEGIVCCRPRIKPGSLALKSLVIISASLSFGMLVFLIGYILAKGIPHLRLSLFSPVYSSENVSMFPAIINTLVITLVSLVLSVPLGVFAAVFLVEYAGRGNRLVALIRLTSETLSGIPSIVYGLFGLLFFVAYLGWGFSILAGSATLAIMVLPLIMRTAEEALKSVPDGYREASFGLGAGKLRTVFKIVLPSAVPGILAGVILGVGRIAGETAALIYTAGTVAGIPSGSNFLMDSGRTLSVHMYILSGEGFNTNEAFATAVVLLLLVLFINTISSVIAKKAAKI
ncbi:MAG: phosphate ABC transporter permease PstA [Eubacteriales bacterium]|nr:phosphate ABC transporter permease PstA [Eubacteriales bacterium]